PSPSPLLHTGYEQIRYPHHRPDVLVVERDPLARSRIQPRLDRERARVVDQNVDTAGSSQRGLDYPLRPIVRTHIADCRICLASSRFDLLNDSKYFLLAPSVHNDKDAFQRERLCDRLPDSRAAARDQCPLSLNLQVHLTGLLSSSMPGARHL